MTYTAIMNCGPDGRGPKYQTFNDEQGATDHVAAHIADWPDAFVVETPAAPIDHWLIDMAAQTVTISPPPLSVDLVIAERNARLAGGFDFNFGDARGTHRIGTTEADMKGWDEVTSGANAFIAKGLGSTAINLVTDTGPVQITADEWQDMLIAAAAFRQPIWQASFLISADVAAGTITDAALISTDIRWPAAA